MAQCRRQVGCHGKSKDIGYYVDCFDWASKISLKRPNEVHWLIADTYVYPHYLLLSELKRNGMKGKLPDCHPMKLMKAVLTDSRMEPSSSQKIYMPCLTLYTDRWNLTNIGTPSIT